MCAPPAGWDAEIAAVNRRFQEAYDDGDVEALTAMYTDDAMVMAPNAEIISGAEAICDFWRRVMDWGTTTFLKWESFDLEGFDDTAIEVGQYTIAGPDGHALATDKFIVVWKHVGGTWKLHRDIWNSNLSPVH